MNGRYDDTSRMNALNDLEELKELIENAKGVFLSQNCIVNREEVLHILASITNSLPQELKQSKIILKQANDIIDKANQESKRVMDEVQDRASQMLREDQITLQAEAMAKQIIDEAEATADYIHSEAVKYANEKLGVLEDTLTNILLDIRRDREPN